jgi:hypothetical protein
VDVISFARVGKGFGFQIGGKVFTVIISSWWCRTATSKTCWLDLAVVLAWTRITDLRGTKLRPFHRTANRDSFNRMDEDFALGLDPDYLSESALGADRSDTSCLGLLEQLDPLASMPCDGAHSAHEALTVIVACASGVCTALGTVVAASASLFGGQGNPCWPTAF